MGIMKATASKRIVKKAQDEFEFDDGTGLNVVDFDEFKEGEELSLDGEEGDLPSDEEDESSDALGDMAGPSPSKSKSVKHKAVSDWSLEDNWFPIPPQTSEGVIPKSRTVRIGKKLDVTREPKYRVWIDGNPLSKASVSSIDSNPAPNQASYNWNTGKIRFPEGSEGKSFKIEFHIRGFKPVDSSGKPIYMRQSRDEEYDAVNSLKTRSAKLWSNILNHPNPDFIRDHIIPRIEDELDHMRSSPKHKNVPDITGDMMKLEHLLHKMEEGDSDYTKTKDSFILEDTYYEAPVGSTILGVAFGDSNENLTQVEGDPEAGEYLLEEDVVIFSEEDEGLQIVVTLNSPSATKEDIIEHISSNIAPKLAGLHSLATLLAESAINTNADDDDDVSDLPGMENGAQSMDPHALRYAHRVRGEANGIESDLRGFAQYHIPKIAKLLQSGSTYFPKWEKGKRKAVGGRADEGWFRSSVRPVFEKAGIDLSALLTVALDAFLQGVFDFDYDKRPQSGPNAIKDPKDYKIASNPMIWSRVASALHSVFEKVREEQKPVLESGHSQTLVIPEGGGEVSLQKKKINANNVKIVSMESGNRFKKAGGLFFKGMSSKQGTAVSFNVKNDNTVDGSESPLAGRKFGPAEGSNKTTISVESSDGVEFTRVPKDKSAVPKIIKTSSDPIFYFAHSSGALWVNETYKDLTFKVHVSGKNEVTTGALVGKDQYSLNSKDGIVEFSPKNGGEKVSIEFSHDIYTDRMVSPIISTDDDGDEVELDPSSSVPDDDESTKSQARENALKLIDYISEVTSDPDESRLSDKEKVLINGLFGIGTNDEKALSIREIVQDEPFNFDLSTKSGVSSLSTVINVMHPKASKTLADILRDKVRNDPGLQDIMKSRSFNQVLFSDGKPTDKDKVLKYLSTRYNEDRKKDPTIRLREFLNGMLRNSNKALSEDEENILRYAWGLPGELRRDDPDLEEEGSPKKETHLPGGAATPLPLIAELEFGLDSSDEKAVKIVEGVYDRALPKFEKVLETGLQRKEIKTFLEKMDGGSDFLKFYRGQRDKETLIDLIIDDDDAPSRLVSPVKTEKQEKASLFEQIRSHANAEDESVLRDMLVELEKAQEGGKTLTSMVESREKTLSGASKSDLKKMYGEVEELHRNFLDASQTLSDIKKDIQSSHADRIEILKKIRSEADEDMSARMTDVTIALRSASNPEEKAEARNKMQEVVHAARAAASNELQLAWKENSAALTESKSELNEWTTLIQGQKKAMDNAHKNPLLKAQLELDHLTYIRRFFIENDNLAIGDGKFILNNLFDQKDPSDLRKKLEEWTPKDTSTTKSLQPDLPKDESQAAEEKSRGLKERARELDERKKEIEKTPKKPRTKMSPGEEEVSETSMRTPGEKVPSKMRSLFNQLVSAALPMHGDDDEESREEDTSRFFKLMTRMKDFVELGEGTVSDFISDPGTSRGEALPDEGTILGKVKEFLRDHARDLQVGENSWDLSSLFDKREVKDTVVKKDMIPMGVGAEALQNAQDLSIDQAKVLHGFIRMMARGIPAARIKRGLQSSRSLEAGTAAELLMRLEMYKGMHPEDKELKSLYSGDGKLTSIEEGDKRRPLRDQIKPLIDSLAEENEGDSDQQAEAKAVDMLSRMGDLAEQGLDLNSMSDHFMELDSTQEAPYSLAYLFQRVRNYLARLNRSVGLQNMVSNFNLSQVFPGGASLEEDTDVADGEYTAGMTRLIEDRNLSDKEASYNLRILKALQRLMVDTDKNFMELARPLVDKGPTPKAAILHILSFLKKNKTHTISDFPGIVDLSFLTGVPFEPPASSVAPAPEEPTPKAEAPTPEVPAPAPAASIQDPSDPGRAKQRVDTIRKKLKGSSSIDRKVEVLRSLIESGAISEEESYKAVMSSGLPPSEVLALRTLFSHEQDDMDDSMPEPTDYEAQEIEPPAPTPEATPESQAPSATPAPAGPRGRLPRELSSRVMSDSDMDQVMDAYNSSTIKPAEAKGYLSKIDLSGITTYSEAKKFQKEILFPALERLKEEGNASAYRMFKKAWKAYLQAFAALLRTLGPAPEAATDADDAPVGKKAMIAALSTLSAAETQEVQNAFSEFNKTSPIGNFFALSLKGLTNIRDHSNSPALDKFIAALGGEPVPEAAPAAPTPAPAPAAPVKAPLDLEMFKTRAVDLAQGKNWNADQFGEHIRNVRPDLLEIYEKIKPEVQKSLEEIAANVDLDLSGF